MSRKSELYTTTRIESRSGKHAVACLCSGLTSSALQGVAKDMQDGGMTLYYRHMQHSSCLPSATGLLQPTMNHSEW